MQKIILATNNQNKIHELNGFLSEQGFEIVSQRDYYIPDAHEVGLTFVENAIIKARQAAALTNLPAIADDSGLAVDALHGAPGIHSARYGGLETNDQKNNQKLLHALADIPANKRSAFFYCVLVYLKHKNDSTPVICQGKWQGHVLTEPRGKNGFGYDPLFYIPELGRTAAELSDEEKKQASHRGQALKLLIKAL